MSNIKFITAKGLPNIIYSYLHFLLCNLTLNKQIVKGQGQCLITILNNFFHTSQQQKFMGCNLQAFVTIKDQYFGFWPILLFPNKTYDWSVIATNISLINSRPSTVFVVKIRFVKYFSIGEMFAFTF